MCVLQHTFYKLHASATETMSELNITLELHIPSLVPGHVLAGLQHVVPVPARDGDEGDTSRVVSDLLDEARDFLLDLLEPSLAVRRLGGVHLVDSHDQLL